jgi:hypothetical protein
MVKSFKIVYLQSLKPFLKKKRINFNKIFFTILKNYYNFYSTVTHNITITRFKDMLQFYTYKNKNKLDLTTVFNQK